MSHRYRAFFFILMVVSTTLNWPMVTTVTLVLPFDAAADVGGATKEEQDAPLLPMTFVQQAVSNNSAAAGSWNSTGSTTRRRKPAAITGDNSVVVDLGTRSMPPHAAATTAATTPTKHLMIPTNHHNETTTHQKEQQQQQPQPHWLETIHLGNYLGSGVASVAFEVRQLPPLMTRIMDHHDSANTTATFTNDTSTKKKEKEYIIKFTGDRNRNGKAEPKFADFGAIAVELTERLSPHPSIPRTILFEKNIANPFRTGMLPLPTVELSSKSIQKRLLQPNNMSIAITERATQTHAHVDEDGILNIPPSKVQCFWRRLFEILDYIHSRNVLWIDTKLWNILLHDGEIILFDWHTGQIVEEEEPNTTTTTSTTSGKLPPGHVRLADLDEDEVWSYDVYKVGKRIREYLDSVVTKNKKKNDKDEQQQQQQDWKNNNDLLRLDDLRKMMQRDDPPAPSMGWFLKNHAYFVHHQNETCSLIW